MPTNSKIAVSTDMFWLMAFIAILDWLAPGRIPEWVAFIAFNFVLVSVVFIIVVLTIGLILSKRK